MNIKGIGKWTPEEVEDCLAEGGRLVFYEYCISLVFITLRRPTGVYLLKKGELGLLKGLPYTILSLLLGWWGIPWGPIYSIQSLATNLGGGKDVTREIVASLGMSVGAPAVEPR